MYSLIELLEFIVGKNMQKLPYIVDLRLELFNYETMQISGLTLSKRGNESYLPLKSIEMTFYM